MKKRLLILALMIVVIASVFAISVSAEEVDPYASYYDQVYTAHDGTPLALYEKEGENYYPLAWFYDSASSAYESFRVGTEVVFCVNGATTEIPYGTDFRDNASIIFSDTTKSYTMSNLILVNLHGTRISHFSGSWTNLPIQAIYCNVETRYVNGSTFNRNQSLTVFDIPKAHKGALNFCGFSLSNCPKLTYLYIPQNGFFASNSVFEYSGLTKVEFAQNWEPQSWFGGEHSKAIVSYAFNSCKSLSEVILPSTATSIGDATFKNCTSLTSITIPDGVTSIGGEAFNGCTSLATVNLSQSLETVGKNAFRSSGITSITFPSTLVSIGQEAFRECASLVSVSGLVYADNTTLADYQFYKCSKLVSVDLPAGLTTLSRGTFELCSSLVEIELPTTLTEIGTNAFSSCASLKTVYKSGATPVEYGFIIPEGITTIGSNAFRGCDAVKYIKLPSSLTSLGAEALRDNDLLEYVDFGGCTLTTDIGNYMFYNDKKLKAVSLPESYTNLNYQQIFTNCADLEALYLPRGLTALRDLNGHTKMYFVDKPFTFEWSNGMFESENWGGQKPEKPEIYYFPSGLTTIEQLLNGCKAVNDVLVFPESFTRIEHEYAFYNLGGKKVVFLGEVSYFKQNKSTENTVFYFLNENVTESTVDFAGSTSDFTLYFHGSGKGGKLKNASVAGNWVEANVHVFVLDLAPSCEEVGYNNYKCFCGAEAEEKEEIAPIGHIKGEFLKINYINGFLEVGYYYYSCGREGCCDTEGFTVMDNAEYQAAPIFKNAGYSYSATSMMQGFAVNHEALNEYERANGKPLQYGLIAASNEKLGNTDTLFNGTEVKSGTLSVSFDDKRQYSIFEMKVTGLAQDYYETELFICAYVIDDGEVSYIDNGENTDVVNAVTYNQVVARVEEGSKIDTVE